MPKSEKNMVELLEFIDKNKDRNGRVSEEIIKKDGFSSHLLAYCINTKLIDSSNRNYFLISNGWSLLNQYNLSKNTRKVKEATEKLGYKLEKGNKIMEEFSKESEKSNEKLRIYTWILIIIAILTCSLSILTIKNSIMIEREHKNQEIDKLESELQSLDLELRYNIDTLKKFRDTLNLGQANFDLFILKNLEKQISNPNIRNQTFKSYMMGLYISLLQANNLLEIRNDPVLLVRMQDNPELTKKSLHSLSTKFLEWEKKINLEGNIQEVRSLIGSYFCCVEDKRSFDKC